MAGEETSKSYLDPREALSLITSFLRMMQDEENKAAEHESWLKANIEDDTLREALSIKAESLTTHNFLITMKEMTPTLLTLLDPNQLEQYNQEFNTAMDELYREMTARQQRLDEINADHLT